MCAFTQLQLTLAPLITNITWLTYFMYVDKTPLPIAAAKRLLLILYLQLIFLGPWQNFPFIPIRDKLLI